MIEQTLRPLTILEIQFEHILIKRILCLFHYMNETKYYFKSNNFVEIYYI